MKTPFGFGQLLQQTPAWAKTTFKIFFYAAGLVTIALDVFTEIPPDVKAVINAAVIKAMLLVHLVSRMFGIDADQYDQRPK